MGGLGGTDWVSLTLLVAILFIVIYHKRSIAVAALFRLGVIFYALSIAVPPFALPLTSLIVGKSAGPAYAPATGGWTPTLLSCSGPVLQALTVLCLFNALMPRIFTKPAPAVPEKHPLDD